MICIHICSLSWTFIMEFTSAFNRRCHLACAKFRYPKRIYAPIPLIDGFIHCRTCTAAAVQVKFTDNVKWKIQANAHCRENLLNPPGIPLDSKAFISLLQACASIEALKQVHAHIFTAGAVENIYMGTKLVSMYANCDSIENARLVFDKLSKPNAFLWNVMIKGYAENGFCEEALSLYYQMWQADTRPDNFTFPFVLKACAGLSALQVGKQIHDQIVRMGFESDVFVGNSLVAMYAQCGYIRDARQAFDKMSERDVVSWNAMIDGYAQNGHADEALTLFDQMQVANMKPNPVTFVNVLSACANTASLQQGKWIHDYITRSGVESDVFVGNSLVTMYARCGSIEIAHQVFDKMSERNTVSWNAMIAGYAQNGYATEALDLFNQMQVAGMKPNSVTVVSVLQACTYLGALQQGKRIHDYIIQNRLEANSFVQNSLIDMYAKCGRIEIARQLFDKMSSRSVISWSALIAGYAQSGLANEALTLFHHMQLANIRPNSITMVSMLSACTHLAALQQGKRIHGHIIKSGFVSDTLVGTAVIDMYAKCGSVDIARQFFDNMSNRNVISWSAMIAGYAMHGHGKDALDLFVQMQQIGMKPNHITFVSVLYACSHAGLVDEGWRCFDCMIQKYRIMPRVEHYACMVDLLGRAGRLDEAHDFICKMPLEPSACVWGALLNACRIHRNIQIGECVAGHLFDLEPGNAGSYVLLSNIYAAARRWDDVAKIRTMMKDQGLKKTPGCSLIELNNRVHAFRVGDISHPESDKIYATLQTLAGQMEEAGYAPNTDFVLHNVDEEQKEHMLGTHSEKLAIAFGLINTDPGTPIVITNNLRVCGDCHSASKFISKIVKREIVVRDVNRFHHFKDGLCSCGDYW